MTNSIEVDEILRTDSNQEDREMLLRDIQQNVPETQQPPWENVSLAWPEYSNFEVVYWEITMSGGESDCL